MHDEYTRVTGDARHDESTHANHGTAGNSGDSHVSEPAD